jgi:triosephosphate isomerase (TIM)
VHKAIREWFAKTYDETTAQEVRIIYGGSVTDKSSKGLAGQPDVDGFLVGGASLQPAFVTIINSTE